MATYPDPDAFFDQSQVDWGMGGGRSSIRVTLQETNRAAFTVLKALTDKAGAVTPDLDTLAAKIAEAVWTKSYVDDTDHQGAGRADLVVGDTSRRTEKIQGLWEQVGVLNDKVDALTKTVADLAAALVKPSA